MTNTWLQWRSAVSRAQTDKKVIVGGVSVESRQRLARARRLSGAKWKVCRVIYRAVNFHMNTTCRLAEFARWHLSFARRRNAYEFIYIPDIFWRKVKYFFFKNENTCNNIGSQYVYVCTICMWKAFPLAAGLRSPQRLN